MNILTELCALCVAGRIGDDSYMVLGMLHNDRGHVDLEVVGHPYKGNKVH